jgi:hypothetical protein
MRNTPTLHVFTAMPYDPTLPAPNSPLESQVIRDQLQALFVLINNIASIAAAQVDSVNTLPPSSPANASVSVSGTRCTSALKSRRGRKARWASRGRPLRRRWWMR